MFKIFFQILEEFSNITMWKSLNAFAFAFKYDYPYLSVSGAVAREIL